MSTTLIHNGVLHTSYDPFATAMLIEGREIAWIGAQGAALEHAPDADVVIDLSGALVAPAFVDVRREGEPAKDSHDLGRAGVCSQVFEGELSSRVVRSDSEGRLEENLAELMHAGESFCLASGTERLAGWWLVAQAAFGLPPGRALTARAAFAAVTRGVWRASGRPDIGELRPGASASLAVWQSSELVVESVDERISAWSTDPRSGTPVLPRVSGLLSGGASPLCLLTMHEGERLHG